MVQERPTQFGAPPRFGLSQRPDFRPTSSAPSGASPSVSRANALGIGLGTGARGLGKTKGMRRHMKIRRDSIMGVTKGDIRRLARRGGVKRIAGTIYDDVRQAMKSRLTHIMREVIALVELRGAKTVAVQDIIYILNRQGRSLYGFDP